MSSTVELPLEIVARRLEFPRQNADIVYPVVVNYKNTAAKNRINEAILNLTYELIVMQVRQLISQGYKMLDLSITGWFEIKTNERGLLSLTIGNYTIATPAAHGLTFIKSLTFDIKTGKTYSLAELFKPGSDYVAVLSALVKAQINERQIPLLTPFTAIKPDQDYYLADKSLVIYFQQYEITPGSEGLPMFPINVYDLTEIALPDGPLEALAAQ